METLEHKNVASQECDKKSSDLSEVKTLADDVDNGESDVPKVKNEYSADEPESTIADAAKSKSDPVVEVTPELSDCGLNNFDEASHSDDIKSEADTKCEGASNNALHDVAEQQGDSVISEVTMNTQKFNSSLLSSDNLSNQVDTDHECHVLHPSKQQESSSGNISATVSVAEFQESSQMLCAVKVECEQATLSSEQDDILEEPPDKRRKVEEEGATLSDDQTCTSGNTARVYQFKRCPKQLTGAWMEFESTDQSNYLRGCKWAPDGTCLLTNSNDNILRLFNLPQELYAEGGESQNISEMTPVLKVKEADSIYDFCWLPTMSSTDRESSCFVVTSRDTPIHMFDAYTGSLRCSYRAYDQMDELTAAHCVSFSPKGDKLYCGFNKKVRVFDVTRPGRECLSRPTFAKLGQRGIISCISHSPTVDGLYAAGSYSKSIALYHEPMGEMACMFEGQQGGITQVHFSPDGSKLYSGGRKDNEILCWDIRNPGQLLFSLIRKVSTNQRIQFDITPDGQYVVSGCQDGQVLLWDTTQAPVQMAPDVDPVLKPLVSFTAHQDTVNGVSLHPTLPVLASASGQRHFQSTFLDSDGEGEEEVEGIENSLLLWWI